MSLGQVLIILWRRGWIAVLALIASVVVAAGVLLFVPGRYDAVATASMDPGSIDPVTESTTGAALLGLMQGNILQLVTSQRVALEVVKRLNMTGNRQAQQQFQESGYFGRENIDDWMASTISKNVDPKFALGTGVLEIKYKAADPNQAALLANAFLAATIDATVAMKASSGDQTASWFAPQLEELRKEVETARNALESFQARANVAAPTGGADTETSELMAITQNLSSAKSNLAFLQNRLTSGSTELSNDPSDPDLQLLAGLKEKLTAAEATIAMAKNSLGSNNPKMVSETANLAALHKQIAEATNRMHEHLKERIAQTQSLIPSLEAAQEKAQKTLIAAQAQRDRLGDLERDLAFRIDQLNTRQKMAAQARLQSKLTFADIAVLDKAVPPVQPSFPKPTIVLPVAIGAGLTLGIILAMLAEMLDRRIRHQADLEFATSKPVLGEIKRLRPPRFHDRSSGKRLRPA